MLHLALATEQKWAALSPDDQLLVAALRDYEIHATPVVWDEPVEDKYWTQFDAVLIRSTWNYVQHLEAFLAWINHLEQIGVRLWNPPSILRWNAHKTYLRDLEARGVVVPGTRWLERGASGPSADLHALMQAHGWQEAVIKPTVSAGAFRTHRVRLEEAAAAQPHLDEMLSASGAMIQEYLTQIAEEGEWSFVFFGQEPEYSHTVLKRPKAGDYRVQIYYGGTWEAAAAPAPLLAQAHRVLGALESLLFEAGAAIRPLYARVDGVSRKGTLVLVELELLEPYLYLNESPGSASRFAAAIRRALEVE